MAEPNVLLLDEPTNDLDIPTLIALEEYLDDFPGALIVVSHDRYFLDRTAESIFKFESEGKIREFPGDYTAYLETIQREASEKREKIEAETRPSASVPSSTNSPNESTASAPKKLSFKEHRELEELELKIPETEKRLAEIDAELVKFATDSFKLNELVSQQNQLNAELEQFIERWAELAERADL